MSRTAFEQVRWISITHGLPSAHSCALGRPGDGTHAGSG